VRQIKLARSALWRTIIWFYLLTYLRWLELAMRLAGSWLQWFGPGREIFVVNVPDQTELGRNDSRLGRWTLTVGLDGGYIPKIVSKTDILTTTPLSHYSTVPRCQCWVAVHLAHQQRVSVAAAAAYVMYKCQPGHPQYLARTSTAGCRDRRCETQAVRETDRHIPDM